MKLRKLEKKDAPFMLEWMHDNNVTVGFQRNFGEKTLADCEKFIEASQNTESDFHMAVADDKDEYMGTVSLKNIHDGSAEFAITMRSCAMGKGFSKFAMAEIIRMGFETLGLSKIYWCVLKDNARAIRFYDKNGYSRISGVPAEIYGGGVSAARIQAIRLPLSCGTRFSVLDFSRSVIHCAHNRTAFKVSFANKRSCSMFAASLEVV